MMMSKGDIAKDFREAKNKRSQIETLAIMNEMTEAEIVEILVEYGVDESQLPIKYQHKEDLEMLLPSEDLPEAVSDKKIVVPESIRRILEMRITELDILIQKNTRKIQELQADQDKLCVERSEMKTWLEKGTV